MNLKERLNKYLTGHFIGKSEDLPDDECITEAEFILEAVREHIRMSKLPKYSECVAPYGKRPKDIIYAIGCIDTREAILKELEK